MNASRRGAPTLRITTAALGAAVALSFSLGAAPAYAEEAVSPAPDPIIVVEPAPSDPAPADPAPADPAPVEPAPDPAPADPAPVSPAQPKPAPETPAPPPASPAPGAPLIIPPASVSQPPAILAPVVPPVAPAQTEVVSTPTPTATPSASASAAPASAAPSKTSAPQPVKEDALIQSSPVVQAAVTAATGSPLGVQVLTVLILLAAGVAYFRAMGSKGRVISKGGK